MLKLASGMFLAASLIAATSLGAQAQQAVKSSADEGQSANAGHQCGYGQAVMAAIEDGEARAEADRLARINAVLDNALASAKSRPQAAQSPGVFPPNRSGS